MIAPAVYRSGATLLVAALLSVAGARAQDAPQAEVVLLNNGNVLEGSVQQQGGTITVSNGTGRVVQLPASNVLCWGPDRQALYRYRVDNRSGSGVDDHLADAQWCLRQGLLSLAADELRAAYRIHPRDPRLPAFERRLRHAADAQQAAAESARSAASAKPAPLDAGSTAPPQSHPPAFQGGSADTSPANGAGSDAVATGGPSTDSRDPTAPSSQASIPRHLVNQYITRIQPLLIHGCGQAGCHGGRSDAAWQMTHVGLAARLPNRLTGNNLQAVLRWVDRRQPDVSPLLVRASSPHGGATNAPLGPNDTEAVAELQRWITGLAERSESGEPASESPAPAADRGLAASQTDGRGAAGSNPQRPLRLPPVVDPFDPDVFNRMYHPQWAD